MCAVQCNTGYAPLSAVNISCGANGWSPSQPVTCAKVTCPVLLTPSVTLDCSALSEPSAVGTVCAAKCPTSGAQLYGSPLRECQADGTWSGADAFCRCGTSAGVSGISFGAGCNMALNRLEAVSAPVLRFATPSHASASQSQGPPQSLPALCTFPCFSESARG